MIHLNKMPSIGQFKNAIYDISAQAQYQGQDENDQPIYDRTVKLPTVTFNGTVKVHGTSASVVYDGENLWAQSKKQIITPEKDNCGFANFVSRNHGHFLEHLKIQLETNDLQEVAVFGEWAGKGIQSGVGISELEKTFYPFGIKFLKKGAETQEWAHAPELYLEKLSEAQDKINSIYGFETYEIKVDFNDPVAIKEAQNEMVRLTLKVEEKCPVAGKGIGDFSGEFIIENGKPNKSFPEVIRQEVSGLPDGSYSLDF